MRGDVSGRAVLVFGAALCALGLAVVLACRSEVWEEGDTRLVVERVISCSSWERDASCAVVARDPDGGLLAVTTSERADPGDRLLCDRAGMCSVWRAVSW